MTASSARAVAGPFVVGRRGRRVLALASAAGLATLLACAPDPPRTTTPDSETQLRALPYLDMVPARERLEGVRRYDRERSYPGLNLFKDGRRGVAVLMEMDGSIRHTWDLRGSYAGTVVAMDHVVPGSRELQRIPLPGQAALKTHLAMGHGEVDARGNLYCHVEAGDWLEMDMIKLDWDSREVWRVHGNFHHDFDVRPNGSVYALTRAIRTISALGHDARILDDFITEVSPDGRIVRRISIYDLVRDRIPAEDLQNLLDYSRHPPSTPAPPEGAFDLFHTNSIEILDRNLPGIAHTGDALVSIKNLDLVAVVDLQKRAIFWSWGPGELQDQHDPSLLPNGDLLIFDNGTRRGFSRILELDPRTRLIAWSYAASPPNRFFSPTRGSSQQLPNGNVLVAESDRGRAFEIDREGHIVWQFLARRDGSERAAIYRIQRIVPPLETALRALGATSH